MALLQGKGRTAGLLFFLFIIFLSWPKCYAMLISSTHWWVESWQLNKTLFLSVKDKDKKLISLFQRQDALQDRKVRCQIPLQTQLNVHAFPCTRACTEQTRRLFFCFCALQPSLPRKAVHFSLLSTRCDWLRVIKMVVRETCGNGARRSATTLKPSAKNSGHVLCF